MEGRTMEDMLTVGLGPRETAFEKKPTFPGQAPDEGLILRALRAEGVPLTLMQLRARTGMPVVELHRITDKLCADRSVSRLNTIIESFCLGMQ